MLGSRIKQLREEMGLKQEELANKMLVSPSAIGMYETNKREPNNELILKLAEYFNVSTDFLLGKSDVRNPENTGNIQQSHDVKLDINGLDSDDLIELQKQIDYIKKLKKQK